VADAVHRDGGGNRRGSRTRVHRNGRGRRTAATATSG